MVLNLEESVAMTQNFVSSVNLRPVLTFLRTQNPELVSGCRFDQRASLHRRFEQAMDTAHPTLMKQVSATRAHHTNPSPLLRNSHGEAAPEGWPTPRTSPRCWPLLRLHITSPRVFILHSLTDSPWAGLLTLWQLAEEDERRKQAAAKHQSLASLFQADTKAAPGGAGQQETSGFSFNFAAPSEGDAGGAGGFKFNFCEQR